MPVQSLATKNTAWGAKKETSNRTWRNKSWVVDEKTSMALAEALNTEMYRAL